LSTVVVAEVRTAIPDYRASQALAFFMPARAKSICKFPSCKALIAKPGWCEEHKRHDTSAGWKRKKKETQEQRVRGRRLTEMRAALFYAKPLCAMCEAEGRITLATERDHIINLASGGTDTEDNTQGLCRSCHRMKTAEEARRGRLKV